MNTSKPSFSIYRADGSKVPGLKKSFLIKQYITPSDIVAGKLALSDGTSWTLVLDRGFEEELFLLGKKADIQCFYCICSYQVHEDGNFVVARLCKDKQDNKGIVCPQMNLALA